MTDEWKRSLIEGATHLGVTISVADAERLARFADRLMEWGAKMDLTSIRDPNEIREKHFLDSIAGAHSFTGPGRLADLGSGAGFPGIVLAILRPDLDVLSVDSRSKKCVFQRQVVRDLKLTNVRVESARIEDLVQREPAPRWITARALADLAGLLHYTAPWLSAGATLVVYKSARIDEELAAAEPTMTEWGLRVLDRREFLLPESNSPRILLAISKDG